MDRMLGWSLGVDGVYGRTTMEDEREGERRCTQGNQVTNKVSVSAPVSSLCQQVVTTGTRASLSSWEALDV